MPRLVVLVVVPSPGAAGNLATEDLVSMAHQMGYETGIDEKALLETSHFAGEIIGQQIGGRMAGWMTYQMSNKETVSQ